MILGDTLLYLQVNKLLSKDNRWRWEHCLVFGWSVCCEPPPLSRHQKSSHKLIMCLQFTNTKGGVMGWLYGMEMDLYKSRILDGVLVQNKILWAGVSNRMHQCLNFLVLNVHIPTYLGSRGKPFLETSKFFLVCLPIIDMYDFVRTKMYFTNSHTLIYM